MKALFRSLALLLVSSLLLSGATLAAPAEDYDIPDDWSHDALVFAVENDILRGNESGDLLPQKSITRAEMAAMLVRLLGASEAGDLSAFRDIPADAWYISELSAAYAAGLLEGISSVKMAPEANITREQAVTVLCRAFGIVSQSQDAYLSFSDAASVSVYARPHVSAMRALGILNGYGDGSFRPKGSISRAEVAQLIYHSIDCIADTPQEIPQSGRVLYRGTEPLPEVLFLDGTLLLGPAVPADMKPIAWNISDGLVLHMGGNADMRLSNVKTDTLVCATRSGNVNADVGSVFLWGGGCTYTGDTERLTVLGGSHTCHGDVGTLLLLGGALIHNGSAGSVQMGERTALTLNGDCGPVVLSGSGAHLTVNGKCASVRIEASNAHLTVDGNVTSVEVRGANVTVDGSGYAETIRTYAPNLEHALTCGVFDDVWFYETYQKDYDNALSTVKTMRVPCTVIRTTSIYANRNLTGWIRELPAGTVVYNQWYPSGNVFYVSLEDGTRGWVSRGNCDIPGDAVTTDGTLDYSKATKEGFVDKVGYDSATDYLVWVSRYTQKVIVFQGEKGNWELIKTFPCSTGSNFTPTPEGIFTIYAHTTRWNFTNYYADHVSIFNGGHAFHTILFGYDGSVFDGRVGIPLSHGCVRMLPEDCRYIYQLPSDTRVVIY